MSSVKDNYVLKHTAAVHIENKLSLHERRLFNILLKNSRTSVSEGGVHAIYIKHLAELLGSEAYTNYEFLKEGLHSLVRRSLRFNILNKDKKRQWESSISLLSEVHFDGGMIYYMLSPSLKDALTRPSSYAYLNISFQNSLSSKHSLALWEFCCEQLDAGRVDEIITPYVPLEKLKALLGVDSAAYDNYKVFNGKVLKKSITEVNKKTDINIVSVLTRKNGLRVEAIAFSVMRLKNSHEQRPEFFNEEAQLSFVEPDIIKVINDTIEKQDLEFEASEIGIDEKGLEKFLNKYKPQDIVQAIKVVKKTIATGTKIKNIPGYLWKLLDQGLVEVDSLEKKIVLNNQSRFYEATAKFQNVPSPMKEFYALFAKRYEMDFLNWVAQTEYIDYQDGILILGHHSSFFREWIVDNLGDRLHECGKQIDPNYQGFRMKPLLKNAGAA